MPKKFKKKKKKKKKHGNFDKAIKKMVILFIFK